MSLLDQFQVPVKKTESNSMHLTFSLKLKKVLRGAYNAAVEESCIPFTQNSTKCEGKDRHFNVQMQRAPYVSVTDVLEEWYEQMIRQAEACTIRSVICFLKELLFFTLPNSLASTSAEQRYFASFIDTTHLHTARHGQSKSQKGEKHKRSVDKDMSSEAQEYKCSVEAEKVATLAPVEYLVRLISLLPHILKKYASFYGTLPVGTHSGLEQCLQSLLDYLGTSVQFLSRDKYQDIS